MSTTTTPPLTAADVMAVEQMFLDEVRSRAGAKQAVVRDRFGISFTRYCQVLNQMIDDPAVIEQWPIQTRILRERRASRQRARSARRLEVA